MRQLLSPSQYLEGPATVTSWARPLKAAYIIPVGRPDLAIRAIASSCLTWGGAGHAFVPYDGSLSPEWREVIQRYDPDHLVDLAGMPTETKDDLQTSHGHVHDWSSALDSFFTPGALLHSAALAFLEKPRPAEFVLAVPRLDDTHPLYLQVLATHGVVDETHIDETLKSHGVRPGLRLANVVLMSDADCPDGFTALTLRLSPSARSLVGRESRDPESILTPTGLASAWCPRYPPPQHLGDVAEFEFDEPIEQHASTLVVTGEPDSVSDLCLYWTLRAHRPRWTWPFPIWLPLDHLRDASALAAIEGLAKDLWQRFPSVLRPGARPELHVLSSTVSSQKIRANLRPSLAVTIHTGGFAKFIPRAFKRGFKEQFEVTFVQGGAQMRRPLEEKRIYSFARFDRVAHEVEVAGWRLPQSRALQRTVPLVLWHVTHSGYASWFYPRSAEPLTRLHLPPTWRALEAICEDAGYTCGPSDKGRLAVGLLGLMGSVDRLALLASSSTYKILGRMAEAVGRQAFQKTLRRIQPHLNSKEGERLEQAVQAALELQERRLVSFGELNIELGHYARPILGWLLSRQMLFRGAELRCPNCHLKRWYNIDRIGAEFQCDGCQMVSQSPLEGGSTNWTYRLNELYARAYDQGVLLHLLVAYQRSQRFGWEEHSSLGFYPGVDVLPSGSQSRPAELDYAEVKEGRLVIGECKVDGSRFGQDEAKRLATLANELHCSRVVLGTATRFPRTVTRYLGTLLCCRLDVMERGDLFDKAPRQRRATNGRDEAAQAGEYLADLSRWFFSN